MASFATSYIPTTTATATRSADVASITGANFSSWYRQDVGSIYAEAALAQPLSGTNQFIWRASQADYANTVNLNIDGTFGGLTLVTSGGGAFDGSAVTSGALTANQIARLAGAYGVNDLAAVRNGGTTGLDSSVSLSTAMTRLDIGSDHLGANRIKAGTLRRLTYFPQRLANSTLQAITQ